MAEGLHIGRGVVVPLTEIEVRTSRSSGPGGQHANVTASRVEVSFDVEASSVLGEDEKRRIIARAGRVARGSAQDTRSQARNRQLALDRLRAKLESALVVQRPRRATRPTASSRHKRVESKKRRGDTKRARKRPSSED